MKFSAEWLEEGVSASPELQATDCFLQICVGDRLVSRFVNNDTDRAHDRVVMPAYPLSEGFVRNWWSLISGRTQSFCLRRFREGFALPDLRFKPDGRYISIWTEPFEYHNPPVNFTKRSSERVPIGMFERDLTAFIVSVLDRLSERSVSVNWVQERWNAICESQEDPDELAFCEAAGALGIDPYSCTDEEATLVELSSEPFAEDALPEFLAGCPLQNIRAALDWVSESEIALGDRAIIPGLAEIVPEIRKCLTRNENDERAWEMGYRVAATCREKIGLSPMMPIREPSEIAALFGSGNFELSRSRVSGLRAEVNGAEQRPRVVVSGLGHPRSINFVTMRAIGDYLMYSSKGRAPVNDTYSYRQAVGRAFAAEMLAPAEVIMEMENGGKSIEEIAAERNVSELTIAHHLQNHRANQPVNWRETPSIDELPVIVWLEP